MTELLESVLYQAIGTLVSAAAAVVQSAVSDVVDTGVTHVDRLELLLAARTLRSSYRADVRRFAEEWCFAGASARLTLLPEEYRGYDIPLERLVDAPMADRLFRLR